MASRSKRTEVAADRTLLDIARVAFSDLRRLFHEDGWLKGRHEWVTSLPQRSPRSRSRPNVGGRHGRVYLHDQALGQKQGAGATLYRDQPWERPATVPIRT
jgi:hypothetical protein